jgi:transcriptional regulator with XRE-family HTH domain
MSRVDAKIRLTVATPSEDPQVERIGVRLKRLRLERRLSQRDLSSPGVSYAYISRIEAGARTPSVKALRMLAQKLGVSVDYLETGRDIRDEDDRELRVADAELELRLARNVNGAEATLSAIVDEAVRAGDVRSATRARIAVALAAAQRGNHLDTVEQLEAVVAEGAVSVAARPDVYATLAHSYTALGAADRAVALLERCLTEISEAEPEDSGMYIRFATYLSYALSDAGDYARAADVVRTALARAGDAADPYARVRLLWSLARVAGMEGRSSDALDYMRRAIALLETTDHTLQLARAYLLSGGIEASEGRTEAAETDLERAERLLGAHSEPIDRAMLEIGRSRIAALKSNGAAAVASARNALDILSDFHGGEQGAAVWALARGLALQGETTGADDAFRRAVDLLVVHGRRHEAGEAAVDWGTFLRECGQDEAAELVLQRAADLGRTAQVEALRKN